jgi:Bor protein
MKTPSTLQLGRLALCGLLLSGCYTTTLSSGKPAAPANIEYDEKWHHSAVWGMAELSGPYNLEQVCPGGWSEIKTETSFANGFVQAVTYGIYSPQTVTVRCAVQAHPSATSATPSPAAPVLAKSNPSPEPLPPAPRAPDASTPTPTPTPTPARTSTP